MTLASVLHRVLFVLAMSPLLASCERTNRWQEEVQLSDGAVLRVDRVVSYRAPSGALGQPIGRQALGERLSLPTLARVVSWNGTSHAGEQSGWTVSTLNFGL